MTNQDLISLLQDDLRNERKHHAFYLHSASMITGLHREEYREWFLEEAQDEFKHVEAFATLISRLGGIPGTVVNEFPTNLTAPLDILRYVVQMEQEVADTYAGRLRLTHEMETAAVARVHVFYEDQIADSQDTAWEVAKMITTKSESSHGRGHVVSEY